MRLADAGCDVTKLTRRARALRSGTPYATPPPGYYTRTQPAPMLRSHVGQVQALCFLPFRGGQLLLSGGSDGTLVAWDAHFRTQLCAWSAHAGGVLALQPAPPWGPSAFLSQGRDGCVHVWRWEDAGARAAEAEEDVWAAVRPAAAAASAAAAGGAREAALAQLAALAPRAEEGAPLAPPRLLRTLRVGFGSFCALAQLGGAAAAPAAAEAEGGEAEGAARAARRAPPRSLQEEELWEATAPPRQPLPRLLLAAPALDASDVEVWDAGGCDEGGGAPPRLLGLGRVGPEDAARASAALLGPATAAAQPTSSASLVDDLMQRTGAPTCLALLQCCPHHAHCWHHACNAQGFSSGATDAPPLPAPATPAAAHAQRVPLHPEAVGGIAGLLAAHAAGGQGRGAASPSGAPSSPAPPGPPPPPAASGRV